MQCSYSRTNAHQATAVLYIVLKLSTANSSALQPGHFIYNMCNSTHTGWDAQSNVRKVQCYKTLTKIKYICKLSKLSLVFTTKSFKLEIVQKASPTYKCHTYRKKRERQSEKGTGLVMAKDLWLQNSDIIISKRQLKCGTFEKSVFELSFYTDH